jgi:PAS domain S-box-containing protein
MKTAPLPPNEKERLKLLKRLEGMDSPPEEIFDAIIRTLVLVCEVPIAKVSLTEECRLWFSPTAPCQAGAATPEEALCALATHEKGTLVIPDAGQDARFADNPPVRGEPRIRFFAGAPLRLTPNTSEGALCIMDTRPRTLDARQLALLEMLAGHVAAILKLWMSRREANHEFSTMVMAKRKLQFQKELMEAILDNEPEGVCILLPGGELEQINRAGLDMLEAPTPREARMRALADYVLPEWSARFLQMLDQARSGEHAIAEYRIRGLQGSERWVESHAAPLHDQQGGIANLILITRDVTAIRESQQRLVLAARVFGEAQEGIIITDARSVIVDVNPAFCQITGYSREEIIGQTPRILQSGIQGPDFYVALWNTLIETGHWKGEIWNRKKNGELYAELISINALRNETGQAVNYVALFLDITDIKRQQGEIPKPPAR